MQCKNDDVMIKKLFCLFALLSLFFSSAQQNEEFKIVKSFYDRQRSMLNKEFKKQFDTQSNEGDKRAMKTDYQEFMLKLDSIENNAFIYALVRVKIREDLNALQSGNNHPGLKTNQQKSRRNRDPQYPGGFLLLRKQITDLLYTNTILSDQLILKTDIHFVVERDGSISSVKAAGDYPTFNRQAEIAIYLIPEKFTPALYNGEAVRYRFRLPLSINFE